MYVTVHEPVWFPLPVASTLMEFVAVTDTDVVIEHVVLPEPPVIVHERAVGVATPPEMMSTVATWFVPLDELMVKVKLVNVVPVPGV